MSEIALYNLLKRIDGATDDEIEKAVADVAISKDVATKADWVELKLDILKQQIVVAILIIGAVGLMIKFL